MSIDWDKLRIFHAVAEAGSFTRASEILNLSQSAISRQISTLEHSTGVILFHRHARGLLLTEQGEMLFKTTKDVFGKLAMVEAKLSDARQRSKGPLKVTTTDSFGTMWLATKLQHFVSEHPDIQCTLIMNDKVLNLSMREADVAIRMHKPEQADLIQMPLTKIHYYLYASKEYLNEYSEPKTVSDLTKHRLLCYPIHGDFPHENANWVLDIANIDNPDEHPNVISISTLCGMFKAAEYGAGIAALPSYMVSDTPDLVQVLPKHSGPVLDCYFVYPEERRHSKRIAVFRDFLTEQVSQTQF